MIRRDMGAILAVWVCGMIQIACYGPMACQRINEWRYAESVVALPTWHSTNVSCAESKHRRLCAGSATMLLRDS